MRRTFFLFLNILIVAFSVFAQGTEKVREIMSLDKGWSFHLGDILFPVIKGHQASYLNAKAGYINGAAAPNYDDSAWRILDLPHDWAIEGTVDSTANLSQGYYNRGIGWYRRKFELPIEDKGKHIELQFDGIASHATIWVNGTVLHRNWCGYTSMYIDITPYVNFGNQVNTIAIRVDADAQEGWWYEGAGIYRHTWLVKRSSLHIKTDGIYANPVKREGEKWDIPVEVTLYNSGEETANTDVFVSLISPEGNEVVNNKTTLQVHPLCEGITDINLTVDNPRLWSIEAPNLYKVKTVVKQDGRITDEQLTRCGFRTIRFDSNTGFWLNGKNIKIKGVCGHQDHAGVGVAVPDALWEFRLRKLKEMGVNAYRTAHNPVAKEFLEACDSLGIMVLDENRWFNTSPEYVRQLEWLIRRDRNCPSVILWSVFNEEPMQGTENGYEMVRRMYNVVKKLDRTRPVTAAMSGGFFEKKNVSQAVDVGGFNYQIQNYDRFHELNSDLPLTSTEDGCAFMIRGEYETDISKNIIGSYDTHCASWGATHRKAWKAIAERPWMAGCFYWTGFDYHGEPTPVSWPSVSSFFGIMDLCGFPKMAYYLHKAQWRENCPVLELVPHWNWPLDSIGKPIKVMALSNLDQIKLMLNGKMISEQAVDPYEMNTWTVPYKPGRLEAIGYKNGKEVTRTKIETTSEAVCIRMQSDRYNLLGNGEDAIPITVDVMDKKNRHVPTANNMIDFTISGPAKIIGLGNGDPNCHEPEKGNRRSLFNGLAQVIIQSTGDTGKVCLKASSKGLKPATIFISSLPASSKSFVPTVKSSYMLDKWYFSSLFKDRPDVTQKIADNDMNSWQSSPNSLTFKLLNTNYILLRTTFTPNEAMKQKGGEILFKQLTGVAEIWLNGKCLGIKQSERTEDFKVDFSDINREGDLRVLFKKKNKDEVGMECVTIIPTKCN